MKRCSAFRVAVLFGLLLAVSSLAHAQATRTWVSGVGDDANPCSRTAPCKTFAGAISKTAAGGEINVLDPGGFGAVTITKAITISSEGFEAGVLVSGTNGIVVNAGSDDVVILRGLDIEGLGTGLAGIRFLAGGTLYVEKCTIHNFNGAGAGLGIDFEPSGNSRLFVDDTIVRDNFAATGGGILIQPGAAGSATAVLGSVRLEHNLFGLKVLGKSTVSVHDSVVANNNNNGVFGTSMGGAMTLTIEGSQISNNGAFGILVIGGLATVQIGGNTVTGNATGLGTGSGASLLSFANNLVNGNTANGAPTAVVPQI